ncbi:hypothetical protein Btru_010573 [Bulinus truncatus]|nr:hypothetical protein Btru_010573 [Bulinus truncatus]
MATATVTELLQNGEENFDKSIKEMTMKSLMETISSLQKEMAKEQENFNSLSTELQNTRERNSRQYKQISKDLVTSQQRLNQLMNWSMKCFAQSKEPSPLKRRNSAKGPPPTIISPSKLTNLQRSKSLLSVNQPGDDDEPKRHPEQTDLGVNGPALHRPVIMNTATFRVNSGGSGARVNLKQSPGEAPKQASESRAVLNNVGEAGSQEKRQATDGEQKVAGGKDDGAANAFAGPVKTGGGLYVKRGQPPRVTTVTNISSSKILPSYQQPEPPSAPVTTATTFTSSRVLSEQSVAVPGSLTTPSSSHATPHTPSTPATHSSSVVVVTPRTQVLKPDTPALLISSSGTAPTLHPLQLSSANPGVSKSQTLTGEPMTYKEFRALPSVKLLAKSFGSTTALNTINSSSATSPAPRLSSSQSNLFHGNPLVRSYSSVSICDPPKKTSSTNIIIVKGTAAEQRPSQQAPIVVNGRPPVPHTAMKSQTATSKLTTTLNPSNGATELELARARLKTNRMSRETTTQNQSNVSSSSTEPSQTVDAAISKGEAQNYSAYVKKKDNAPFKTNIATANTIQISNGVARITNPVKTAPVPAAAEHSSASSATSGVPSTSTTSGGAAGYFKRPGQRPADDSHSSKPVSLSTAPGQASSGPDRVVSTASVTIRRAKSREELQEESRQVMSTKDSLLKQIQARRRDDYDSGGGGGGSNVLSMSKLSQSMPSLLLDGKSTV